MQNKLMEFVEEYKAKIDRGIEEEIGRRVVEVTEIAAELVPVVEAMRELAQGGKRLRGLLLIMGYQQSGGKVNEEVIKAAVAVELFHLGLLIQDDVMDRDELRRGVATIHTRYSDKHLGETIATLAGDYTYGWMIEIISKLKFSESQILKAMKVWGKYFTRVGYGQTLDSMAIAKDETILKILSIKSGEYSCVMPLLIGAVLGGADQKVTDRLEKYGIEIGHVFQLRDDWLGMYGDPAKTGKPVGHDVREGKHTYATMYGKVKTEREIAKHLEIGMGLVEGDEIMQELLSWLASREN